MNEMNLKYTNINYAWSSLIVEELVRNGADYFCISPGSRSSPLVLSVAANPKAKKIVHFDERGAAFHALGYSAATKKPCVLISTSGTAAANYFPAVIEAAKKKLPLIILTADRPPELRLTGADQTIDQVKIFGDYVRFFFDMPCPTHAIQPQMVLTTIDQAVHRAKGSPAGPVHINCMFREPLNPQKTKKDIKRYLLGIGAWEKSGAPFTSYTKAQKDFTVAQANEILPILTLAKSGVIVVGKISREEEREQVLKLAEKLNWPVFPDITSGLRFKQHPNIISFYDQLLLSEKFQRNFKADCVLHLGGRITSKRWYQYVEKVKPKNYIMVLDHPLRNDPLHNVTVRVEAPILKFSEGLLNVISLRRPKDKFLTRLHLISQKIDQTIESFIAKDKGLSEITASRLISLQIKEGSGLFLASSLPIREVDMYAAVTNKQLTIESNRGASGIDGTIASATGFLNGINKPATLLIGDLAFLHDLNSLALLQKTKHPLVIVVLNNNGGGIFSFLPVAQTTPHFEKYFGTSHGLNFKAVRDLFDLNYANPKTKKDFTREYAKAFRQSRSTIIEITTGREDTYKEHKDLQQHIVTVVDRLLSS